ncbi:MAG: TRAP transporter large permease subunit [Pseudomonadota bacterium]
MQAVLLFIMVTAVFAGIASGIPVIFVLLGVPILAAIAGSLAGVFDFSLLSAIPPRVFGIMGNQILYAVPLFILMGKLLEHSGLAKRGLFAFTGLFGQSPKALSFTVIGVSVAIACASGIVGATITMLGAIALPAMQRFQFSERFCAGLITASGSLGQIIPPSIALILLSDQISGAHVANQLANGNFAPDPISVGHLFAGALIPGLCLAAAYAVYASSIPGGARVPDTPNGKDGVPVTTDWPGRLVILSLFLVPASILLGFVTATEASAVGVLIAGSFALLAKPDKVVPALKESVELTGVIFGIIVAASVFSLVLRGFEGDVWVALMFSQLPEGGHWALLLVMLVVFLLGFLLEFVEITYVVVPIVAPVLFALGIDPVWFAVLMVVNLQISFLTPPMGISLFYYKSVAEIRTIELYRAVVPFICIQLLLLVFLYLFPPLATWLPSVLI